MKKMTTSNYDMYILMRINLYKHILERMSETMLLCRALNCSSYENMNGSAMLSI
jgi:hypothetical protein